MTTDLTPATDRLAAIALAVEDEQLGAPSACDGLTVADLLQHVDGLAEAFARAARKQPSTGGPTADGDRLPADWRTRIPSRLAELAVAWNEPGAWEGETGIAGLTMPAPGAAAVAAAELVLHAWDLAVATGDPSGAAADPDVVALALSFVEPTATQNPGGTPGLFGPVVGVADDASPLDRLLGLSGRDPANPSRPPAG